MQIIDEITAAGLDITEEEYIKDFLGVNIYKVDSETYHMDESTMTYFWISGLK